jgi:hypothetical protein
MKFLVALVISLMLPATSMAAPKHVRLYPKVAEFSSLEINAFEATTQQRKNRLVMGFVGGGALALVAAGVTFLAMGLRPHDGNATLSTVGINCLGLATVGAFVGLEFITW